MDVKDKKLENAKMELQVEVPQDKVEEEYKKVFKSIQQKAKIDGFRQGKVPINIIEQRFHDIADNEAAENLLKAAYFDVLNEKGYTPIGPPEFDFDSIDRNKPFTCTITFEVPPTVELHDYKGLSAEQQNAKVTDQDIQREVEELRDKHATISKKEDDGVVEKGDQVAVQMKRIDNVDKEEVDSVEYRPFTLVVGKSKEDYAIDKDLPGMKVGDEKEIKVKYPKDYSVDELKGQKVTYLVKIDEINKRDLPELDDEFAKDLGEYETLDEMKSKIRENLEKYVEEKSKADVKSKLLREIVENSTFDIPETMISKEMESIFQRVQQRVGYFAQDINEFASVLNMDVNELSEKIREEAVNSIKTTLVLAEIAKKEELQASEEEYKKVIQQIAEKNERPVEEIEELVKEKGSRENIENELVLDSALDYIYDNAQVKQKKPVSVEEFMKQE